MLKASRKQKPFSTLDNNLVHAVKVGIEKLEEYVNIMKDNDIYFLATILDPRIKTQWIRDNLENAMPCQGANNYFLLCCSAKQRG